MRAIVLSGVSDKEIAEILRLYARTVIRADGDRDHMNHSDLNCEQSVAMARLMTAIADKLSPEGTAPNDRQ